MCLDKNSKGDVEDILLGWNKTNAIVIVGLKLIVCYLSFEKSTPTPYV